MIKFGATWRDIEFPGLADRPHLPAPADPAIELPAPSFRSYAAPPATVAIEGGPASSSRPASCRLPIKRVLMGLRKRGFLGFSPAEEFLR